MMKASNKMDNGGVTAAKQGPTAYSALCSKHFEQITLLLKVHIPAKKQLKPDMVPAIFPKSIHGGSSGVLLSRTGQYTGILLFRRYLKNIIIYPKAAKSLLSNDHVISWTRTHVSLAILSRAKGIRL